MFYEISSFSELKHVNVFQHGTVHQFKKLIQIQNWSHPFLGFFTLSGGSSIPWRSGLRILQQKQSNVMFYKILSISELKDFIVWAFECISHNCILILNRISPFLLQERALWLCTNLRSWSKSRIEFNWFQIGQNALQWERVFSKKELRRTPAQDVLASGISWHHIGTYLYSFFEEDLTLFWVFHTEISLKQTKDFDLNHSKSCNGTINQRKIRVEKFHESLPVF